LIGRTQRLAAIDRPWRVTALRETLALMDNTATGRAAQPRVLVVDDEELDALGCESELSVRGFDVDVAGNVEDARSLLAHNSYAAVLLDVMVPLTSEHANRFVHNIHQDRQGIQIGEALRRKEFEPEGTSHDALLYYVTLIPHSFVFADTLESKPEWTFIKPTPPRQIAERIKLAIEKRVASC